MEPVKEKLKRQFIPHPKGFSISGKASIIFWAAVLILVVALYLLGQPVFAVLTLAICGCGYIMVDVLRSYKNDPPEKKGRRVHTMFTCSFTGIVLIACVIEFIRLLAALI